MDKIGILSTGIRKRNQITPEVSITLVPSTKANEFFWYTFSMTNFTNEHRSGDFWSINESAEIKKLTSGYEWTPWRPYDFNITSVILI